MNCDIEQTLRRRRTTPLYPEPICTTGSLRLGPDEYVLFKNKDFGRPSFEDKVVIEPTVFGVQGITTWAGTDPDLDEFSGFSIGANEHGLLACDNNVRTLPDHQNYDRLVEIALREGTDLETGVDAVRRATTEQRYLWANLVLVDAAGVAAIDVRGHEIEVTRAEDRIARSNHHVVYGATPEDDDAVTSERRLASARARLAAAESLDDVVALQASHDHGDTGICNHSLYDTVYSYLLHRHRGLTTLYVTQGAPCTGEHVRLDLPLGASWSEAAAEAFRGAYPSNRALDRA